MTGDCRHVSVRIAELPPDLGAYRNVGTIPGQIGHAITVRPRVIVVVSMPANDT
jgi:hypothetical protein